MFDEIPELDKKGLRDFGLITGLLVAGLFGLALPYLFGYGYPLWPWVIAMILAIWAFIAPQSMNPVYRVWMRFGLVMGSFVSRLILAIVFFLVVTPIGIMMRAFGHDPMNRVLSDTMETYREPVDPHKTDHFDRPF